MQDELDDGHGELLEALGADAVHQFLAHAGAHARPICRVRIVRVERYPLSIARRDEAAAKCEEQRTQPRLRPGCATCW